MCVWVHNAVKIWCVLSGALKLSPQSETEGDNYVCKDMSRETKTADSSNLSVCVSNNVCALPPYSNIFFSSFKIT